MIKPTSETPEQVVEVYTQYLGYAADGKNPGEATAPRGLLDAPNGTTG